MRKPTRHCTKPKVRGKSKSYEAYQLAISTCTHATGIPCTILGNHLLMSNGLHGVERKSVEIEFSSKGFLHVVVNDGNHRLCVKNGYESTDWTVAQFQRYFMQLRLEHVVISGQPQPSLADLMVAFRAFPYEKKAEGPDYVDLTSSRRVGESLQGYTLRFQYTPQCTTVSFMRLSEAPRTIRTIPHPPSGGREYFRGLLATIERDCMPSKA